ncbi:hypothetical protein Tco_0411746 [Tanacetum coccineum]
MLLTIKPYQAAVQWVFRSLSTLCSFFAGVCYDSWDNVFLHFMAVVLLGNLCVSPSAFFQVSLSTVPGVFPGESRVIPDIGAGGGGRMAYTVFIAFTPTIHALNQHVRVVLKDIPRHKMAEKIKLFKLLMFLLWFEGAGVQLLHAAESFCIMATLIWYSATLLCTMGPTSSLGIIAGERIPHEASPASIPQRHVAGDSFPQRHVAGESPDMSPGKRAIVVVSYEL